MTQHSSSGDSLPLATVVSASTAITQTTSRNAKKAILADLARQTPVDEIATVAAWLSGAPRQRRLGIGWSGLAGLIREVEQDSTTLPTTLTVKDVDDAFDQLAAAFGPGSTHGRRELLRSVLHRATPAEQDFLLRLITGELRHGALESLVVDAAAVAFGVDPGLLRRAAMLSGSSPAAIEVAAREGDAGLARVGLTVGTPVQPMLAASAPSSDEAVAATGLPAVVDDKLDGMRLQAHRSGDQVRLFTRSLDDITARLPGVVASVLALDCTTCVLDGEVLAFSEEGRPALFQDIASAAGTLTATDSIDDPAMKLQYVVFDVLHLDGEDLFDEPFEVRERAWRRVLPERMRVRRVHASTPEQAHSAFQQAVTDGFEGLVVKTLDGAWQAGRRSSTWLKVKPVHTLDLVVLGAEWGSGRRTGTLSNLHLGARTSDGFVMVGKTFKGLTDETLAWQTQALQELETRRTRNTVFVRPELVVEIALDGVQRSSRFPGKVALRFARVVRYRADKSAEEASTLEDVRAVGQGSPSPRQLD